MTEATDTQVVADETTATTETTPAVPVKKDAPSTELQTRIDSTIKTAQDSGAVTDRVVEAFSERELKRRTDLIVQGMDLLVSVAKAFTEINKTDQEYFTATEGKDTSVKTYSKKRIEEINKAKKTRDNVAKAVDKAITTANFEDLEKVLKNKGKPAEDEKAA